MGTIKQISLELKNISSMKSHLVLLLILGWSFCAYSQIYFPPEDFSGGNFPPPGWSIENGGDTNTFRPGPMPLTTEPSCTWITSSSNMINDDRIISPEIYLPASMNAKLYAQMRGSVGYALAMYWDPDNKVRHFIEVSNDGGITWQIVLDLDDQSSVQAAGASFPWPDWEWFDVAIPIDAFAGDTIIFAYHHEKEFDITGGGSFGVTNMGIWEEVVNDAQLQSMDMQEYCVIGEEVEIGGVIKNIGSSDITSFEGEYMINGILSDTFLVDGISIAQFGTYEFTADDPAVFTLADYHSVELVITKVNGEIDNSPENNFQNRDISVATASVDRKPLFEMFTSSTCSTCPGGNEVLDAVLLANPSETYSLVKYQMDWPGAGDPYYIDECGVRGDYYSVLGIPNLVTNGKNICSSYNFNQSRFNEAITQDAYVAIDLEYNFDGINVSADLSVDPMINITDASVHFAVVEKLTHYNIGTNGETEFRNVLMRMMPDGNGTSTTLAPGSSEIFTAEANLLTTFIEEFDDLMIIAWVQDNITGTIMQSESHDLIIVSTDEYTESRIEVFPNPNQGVFSIKGCSGYTAKIFNCNGQEVVRQDIHDDMFQIDLTAFDKGLYFLSLNQNGINISNQKIIIR